MKLFFDQKKIYFFDGIFFKVHLLVQENCFEAVSKRSWQFKTRKSHAKDMSARMKFDTALVGMGGGPPQTAELTTHHLSPDSEMRFCCG